MSAMPPLARRWLMFNAVGAAGVAVQLGTLAALTGGVGLHYLAATVLAVEAAILHNFAWHERWTWAERTRRSPGVLRRLLRFHGANGLVSLLGNALLMRLLVGEVGLPFLVANLIAIAACGALNFAAGEWVVFRSEVSRVASRPS